jgi:integrase
MPTKKKLKLTKTVDGRWRKIYRGKQYHFHGDYATALLQWEARKVELDSDPTASDFGKTLLALMEQDDRSIMRDADRRRIHFGQLKALAEQIEAIQRGERPTARPEQIAKPIATAQGIEVAVKEYLVTRLSRVKVGKLSAGRYHNLKRYLEAFTEFAGPSQPIDSINNATLDSYYLHCLDLGIKEISAGDIFAAAKQFLRWSVANGKLTAPQNLILGEHDFKREPAKKVTMSVEEYRRLFVGTPDRTRLFLLLALNCGYGAKDCADLRHDEVDWQKGRITRKRSKTERHASVPTVEYKLWPMTFRLLKKLRSRVGDLVLLNENGLPLKNDTVRENGYTKSDNIASAYHRLCNRLGILNPKPWKSIRKTGSTMIRNNRKQFGAGFAELYLGHAPRTVGERHYFGDDPHALDEALEWLGEQFDIQSLDTKSHKRLGRFR